jgi:hypothetical protein
MKKYIFNIDKQFVRISDIIKSFNILLCPLLE